MHDMIYNISENKLDKIIDGEIECKCCGRFSSGDNLHALELPKPFIHNGQVHMIGEQRYCNCFWSSESGNYSKAELEEHNRGRTFQDVEQAEMDESEDELAGRFSEQCLALP